MKKVKLDYQTFLGSSWYGTFYVSKKGMYFQTNNYIFNETSEKYEMSSMIFSFLFTDEGDIRWPCSLSGVYH